jgi:hypothetical protein
MGTRKAMWRLARGARAEEQGTLGRYFLHAMEWDAFWWAARKPRRKPARGRRRMSRRKLRKLHQEQLARRAHFQARVDAHRAGLDRRS